MRNYVHHRRTLIVFLVLSFIFEVLLYNYLFSNMDYIISQLSEIYRELTFEKLRSVFQVSNGVDITINIFMYVFGFHAVFSHKVTQYNMFHAVLILAVFSRIVISYLNMYTYVDLPTIDWIC